MKSRAHWLNWKCGIGLGAAREKVRVAHAPAKPPRVAAAMAQGRNSYFKAREMTRVADASNEAFLLDIALYGAASHVEQTVRGYRRALDAAELTREAIGQRDRILWFHAGPDGSLANRGRVPAETARRLACDASVIRVIETESGEPLDVGRKTRTIPPAIRRVLNARDMGCRFPG